MRHGKYQQKRKISAISWVLVGIALLGMTVGGVAAYLSTQSGALTNTFTAETETQPTIVETMTTTLKSNVSVNVGKPGYAVYVRAAVVVTWQDEKGNVLAKVPVEGTDYSTTMNRTDWFQHGDFWYCKTMVNSGNTPVLINSCEVKTVKGGYHLNVEIIAQTIQALGMTDEAVDANGNPIPTVPAVTNAWGITVSTEVSTKGQLIDPSP